MKLLVLFLLAAACFGQATKFNPFTQKLDYVGAGSGSVTTSCGLTGTTALRRAETVTVASGTTYTTVVGNCGATVSLTNAGAIAVSLDSAAFSSGMFATFRVDGAGTATLTPTSGTIGGAANVALTLGQWITVAFDGTNWKTRGTNRIIIDPLSGLAATSGINGVALSVAPEVVKTAGSYSLGGAYDFLTGDLLMPRGTTLPGTCVAGKFFVDSDAPAGQKLYYCVSANTWELQGGVANSLATTGSSVNVSSSAPPTAGMVLTATGATTATWQASQGSSSTTIRCSDDNIWPFAPGTGAYVGPCQLYLSAAGGSAALATTEVAEPGIVTLTTSTSTGVVGLVYSTADSLLFGGGDYFSTALIRIPTLSDGTETFTVTSGFTDSGSAPVDGCYFRYTHSVNSGNWQLVCRSNSAETATNSSSAVAANTWYTLRVEVNAAASLATFFVNGTSVGTVASNIPSGAGRFTQWRPGVIVKSVGTGGAVLQIGREDLTINLASARP